MRLKRSMVALAGALWVCGGVGAQDAAPEQPIEPAPGEAQPPAPAQPEAPQTDVGGSWLAQARLPNGQVVDIGIAFETDDAGALVAGSLDIPAQGVADAELSELRLSGSNLAFTLDLGVGAPARITALVAEDGETFSGEIEQGGIRFPLEARRAAEGEEISKPARPQTPEEPYPYEAREVTFENATEGVTLAGTLTIPERESEEKFAAAVLLSGSGPQDRDESLAGHKPFLVIADHLTRHGIAVLRYDDRGVGGSTGNTMESTIEGFARDALAAIEFLKEQDEIDGSRIGLIGHSEGGAVAPIAASKSPDDVAFVVLLAGMGAPGEVVLKSQLREILTRSGVPEARVEAQLEAQAALLQLLVDDASADQIRLTVEEMVRAGSPPGMPPEVVAAQIDGQMNTVTSPWFKHLMSFDPRPWLRKVSCPVLALNGSLDLQVLTEVNLTAIESALREGGNTNVTAQELEGLNHLFQTAETGLINEYATIDETFSPRALEIMTNWIHQPAAREASE